MRPRPCAACRLRSLIHVKEVARTGRIASLEASILSTSSKISIAPRNSPRRHLTTFYQGQKRSFSTLLSPNGSFSAIGEGKQSILAPRKPWSSDRRLFAQKSGRHDGYKSPSVPEYTRQQFGEFIESLYSQGAISWEEWRHSVFVNAGLKSDTDPVIESIDAPVEVVQLEERVRKVREWFAEQPVPENLLEEEEKETYVRLFGNALRKIEVHIQTEHEVGENDARVLEHEDNIEELEQLQDEEPEILRDRPLRQTGNLRLQEDIRLAMTDRDAQNEVKDDQEGSGDTQRTHSLTLANRFTTFPSTIEVPRAAFAEPVTAMLSRVSNSHLSEAASRIFGGPGLPYSTSTPTRGKLMQQRPIALDASQSGMSEIEGDVYMSTLMPGIFAGITSVLTETRRRLGTQWGESLVRKAQAGQLRILDAGGGGAGVLAVREMLRAEWERMHEAAAPSSAALTQPDGKIGGAGASPPLGAATVLIGSDVLRRRVSRLLENTAFVPRLPDYMHTETAKLSGKFDLVIAPHTLWPLREDYLRKNHVQNLWSLLSVDGGILLLLEKGVARGFELVAGAREMLLNTRVADPYSTESDKQQIDTDAGFQLPKDPGMIVAPCTNHASCPMYRPKGLVRGRRDICAFEQRYYRPQFLQKVLRSKGRNHEDVEFSYLSIMRGRDLRNPSHEPERRTDESQTLQPVPQQDHRLTDRAFQGYEDVSSSSSSSASESSPSPPHSLSLPRLIFPPLKRQGHVILDVCTPAGTLERWTVPRSFSRQAYRDARKSSWGDLWALGAKTRVSRIPKVRRPKYLDNDDAPVTMEGAEAEEVGVDEYGRLVMKAAAGTPGEGGRMRTGRKIKGIRDKRDKKAAGNGRRKRTDEEM